MTKTFKYRLFGRSKGRSKNRNIIDEVNTQRIKKIETINYNIIDIGPGYGESTLHIAKNNNKNVVIACEKYIDGINNIAKKSIKDSLNNIFIFQGNVHQFIDELVPKKSISEVWILFPDPWPKKRHFKRRLINKSFFNKIKKYLKEKAIIHIASDSKSYISHILSSVYEIKNEFIWINQNKEDWDYKNLILPKTKYFQKALKKGHNPFYFKLIKL